MTMRAKKRLIALMAIAGLSGGVAGASSSSGSDDIRAQGVFAFPQAQAVILCDTDSLRLSAWNDAEYLYIQAVLWKDGDGKVGLTNDGREIGDWCNLMLDVDGDGHETAEVDRAYMLNPWPEMTGLHYSVCKGEGASSGITGDSKGHGCIRYVESDGGNGASGKVRVDSFVIPLGEIGKKPGDSVKLAYWGQSPHPEMLVNSVGYTHSKPRYYPHHIPHSSYHEMTFADRPASLAIDQVPEGRAEIVVQATKPLPVVGAEPPEITAGKWLNVPNGFSGGPEPTLQSLHGKVVVVELWATWCGPCVAGIPHLIDLHEKHAKDGLVVLAMTDQHQDAVEKFVEEKKMPYIVGAKSPTVHEYGVRGIPHAFIIGRDGKLLWNGYPGGEMQAQFDAKIEEALKAK